MIARINRFERADESEGAINYYDMPGMLLDTTSKVVRQQSCYEVIKTHKRSSKGDAFKKACLKDLVGSTILTQYNKENYRIDDIDFENSPLSKFDKRGVETSYSAVKSLCLAPRGVPLKISQGWQTPKNLFQGGPKGGKRPKNPKKSRKPSKFQDFCHFSRFAGGKLLRPCRRRNLTCSKSFSAKNSKLF